MSTRLETYAHVYVFRWRREGNKHISMVALVQDQHMFQIPVSVATKLQTRTDLFCRPRFVVLRAGVAALESLTDYNY